MNTNWIAVIMLYGWFLSGLYTIKELKKYDKLNPYQVFFSFFIGPFGLGWIWVQKNRDKFGKFLNSFKQTPEEDTNYQNLVFLDSHGRELFAGKNENTKIVDLVKKMLYDALSFRTSEIFIDPRDNAYVVRFRVDGMIRVYNTLLEADAFSVGSMIKTASGMEPAEKRRPQDGTFSMSYEGVTTTFRVATVGVSGGEKITIRMISSEISNRGLGDIGLSATQLNVVRNSIKQPSGMILVCGPAGSGKTSTLYSMLGAIDYSMKNVISIEGPIERRIPNISQLEVNPRGGITYASLIQNALHQNPDVVSIREIPDKETANLAVRAAQTGYLIIAALPSNDNIGTITRLTELGIPLRSIADSLQLIVSQRLVRMLCPYCRKKAELNAGQLDFCRHYGIPADAIYTSTGCQKCDRTGFSGKRAVFEILTMTDELRAIMKSSDPSVSAIQDYIDKNQGENTIFNITGNMLFHGEIPLEEFESVNNNL